MKAQFRPMLASQAAEQDLRFPLIASPKLDGLRGLVIDGRLVSRSLKPFPSQELMQKFSKKELSGLDGELIFGPPTNKDSYRASDSAIMTIAGQEAGINFYVFDDFTAPGGFAKRLSAAKDRITKLHLPYVVLHEHKLIKDLETLLTYERVVLAAGYEGLILRSIDSPYKFGRSTLREGWMLKLKRFMDSEAKILDVLELLTNKNEATLNELGYTKRASFKANKVAAGVMGAILVKDLKSKVVFKIGTGFNEVDREYFWANKDKVIGKTVKYKYLAIGIKDLPRHPVFLGMRSKLDL